GPVAPSRPILLARLSPEYPTRTGNPVGYSKLSGYASRARRAKPHVRREFLSPGPVIGVTATDQALLLRKPEQREAIWRNGMDKRWLIAAAFLSAASLVACDNS